MYGSTMFQAAAAMEQHWLVVKLLYLHNCSQAHLFCLVAIVVDSKHVLVAICSVYIIHHVVHTSSGGCCLGLLLWSEEI